MSQFKQLFGQTAIYGLSSIVGRLLNFLLVPFYTSVFAPEQYGIVTELYAEVAFLNIIYTFGLETTFFRFSTKYPEKRSGIFNVAQSIILIISVSLSSICILFSDAIAEFLRYPGYGFVIRWLGCIMAIDAIVAVPFARLRLQGKALKFASFKLINIGINLSLNIFFIYYLARLPEESELRNTLYNEEWEVAYVFLSNLIANGLYLLFFFKELISIRISFNTLWWKKLLTYAGPLVILGIAGVTNEMFSRVMLKYLLPEELYPTRSNEEMLGIFGACYKLSVFMTLAVQAFKYAYEPFFFKESVKDSAKNTYSTVMGAFIGFGGLSWMLIVLVLPEIAPVLLQSADYREGLGIVPLLLGGGLFLGIYYNLSVWYKITDKTRFGAVISIAGVAVTITLNLLLIPKMGLMGSAWATLLTYLTMAVISYIWGQKVYYVNYRIWRGIILIAIAGITIWQIDYNEDLYIRYFTGLVGILIYLALFFLLDKYFSLHKVKNS